MSRGAHAGIYADTTHWQDDLLARVEASLQHTYDQFKQRVIDGRRLDPAVVDELAGGRCGPVRRRLSTVWSTRSVTFSTQSRLP